MAKTRKSPSPQATSINSTPATKKLNLNTINKLAKEQSKMREIVVQGEYTMKVQDIFTEDKIDTVVVDFLNLFEKYLIENKNQIDNEMVKMTAPLIHALIIREFTDLKIIPRGYDLNKMVQVTTAIYNVGKEKEGDKSLLEEIMNEFDENQINRVYAKLGQAGNKVGQALGDQVIKNSGIKVGDYFSEDEITKINDFGSNGGEEDNGEV